MKLVEVIRGDATSDATLDAAEVRARDLGKVAVRVRECPGFLVNRVLVRAMAEAYRHAAALGADMAAADRAVVDGGPAPIGPFALGDLIGLDTLGHITTCAPPTAIASTTRVRSPPASTPGGSGRRPGAASTWPRPRGGDAAGAEVAERYYAGALDEARRCVAEGIAAAADVDTAMRLGCGLEAGPLESASPG